jgi:hypothetical protein
MPTALLTMAVVVVGTFKGSSGKLVIHFTVYTGPEQADERNK